MKNEGAGHSSGCIALLIPAILVITTALGFFADITSLFDFAKDRDQSSENTALASLAPATAADSGASPHNEASPSKAASALPTSAPWTPPPLPTYTALPTYTPYPSATPQPLGECTGLLEPRLRVGDQARVIPGLGNNVLNSAPARPSLHPGESRQLDSIPENGVFLVLDGYECRDGIVWWYVAYGGQEGWTGESGPNGRGVLQYWVQALD